MAEKICHYHNGPFQQECPLGGQCETREDWDKSCALAAGRMRTYLGDGLYVEFDGYQIRLFAHNGVTHTNEVFLQPEVLQDFLKFVERVKEQAR